MREPIQNADSTPSNIAEFSVSELSGAIKRTMEDAFGRVRVRGELGRVSRPASGHVYLDLKDDRSVLAGVIWKGAAAKMPIRPEEGLEVIATGRITTFAGQSKYQMVIDSLEPAGEGALMALLEERKRKLAAEGLFAPERKRALPFMPRIIGVVTSPTGAVIRDILHRLNDRFPLHVIVWPVRVQGETSAKEVAAAIDGFNALDGTEMIARPDVLIVARGGGSIEDLWGFNEEIVARAAANSAIPLISAVGHETDTTLIDYVADQRAPTPTGAAEMAVPVRTDLIAHCATVAARLNQAQSQAALRRRDRFLSLARLLPAPDRLLEMPRQRFDTLQQNLLSSLERKLQSRRNAVNVTAAALSPGRLRSLVTTGRVSLTRLDRSLPEALRNNVRHGRRDLDTLARRLTPALIERPLGNRQNLLDQTARRLDRALGQTLDTLKADASKSARLLDTLSYKSVLSRGFALVRDENGQPVRGSGRLKTGDSLQLEFAENDRIAVHVASTATNNRSTKRPKNSAKAEQDDEQQSLL